MAHTTFWLCRRRCVPLAGLVLLRTETDCTFSSPNLEITMTMITSFQKRRNNTYCHHHGRDMQCQSQTDVIITAKMKWKAQEAKRGGTGKK